MSPLAGHSSSRRFLPLLFLLFVGSGCAALIYELVWFQLLQLVVAEEVMEVMMLQQVELEVQEEGRDILQILFIMEVMELVDRDIMEVLVQIILLDIMVAEAEEHHR